MRYIATLLFVCVLLSSTDLRAQDALTINTPPGKPLVWDPEFLAPSHDPETHMVAFRLFPFETESADQPFFLDREGIIVPKEGIDGAVAALSEDAQYVILLCSFPQPGSYNAALPGVRSQYCTLRRAERQP